MFKRSSPTPPRRTSLLRSVFRVIASAMVAVALVGGGCYHPNPHIVDYHMPGTPATTQPSFYTLRFNTRTSEGPGWDDWIAEWKHRFPDGCCLIVGHGCTCFGDWCVVPSVDSAASPKPAAPFPTQIEWLCESLRHDHPTLPIIVISCNADHAVLHVTNVYYSPSNIWILPFDCDTWFNAGSRMIYDPTCVGDMKEFIHTPAPEAKK
jgi:hypothetical protein